MPEILHNKIVIAAIIIGFFTCGWFLLGSSSSSSSTSVVQGTTDSVTPTTGDDLIQTLTSLQSVNLDNSFFANPVFASLKDYSRQVTNEPMGRHDPFAPIGAVQPSPASQDQTSSQIQTIQPGAPATSSKPVQTKPRIPAKR